MELTAIFEEWHIGDGNYPPLHRGQEVNLSFQVEVDDWEREKSTTPESWRQGSGANVDFVGSVLRVYPENLVVLECEGFRFYIEQQSVGSAGLAIGDRIRGKGALLLDYYIWVEFLHEYPDPPDLFYSLRVTKIIRAAIPERFVTRHDRGKALPTRVGPEELSADDLHEIEDMAADTADELFFYVSLSSKGMEGKNISRTFHG